jgi:hypothetical protein
VTTRHLTIASLGALLASSALLPAGPADTAPAEGERQSMSMPGLGTNGRLDCEELTFESGTGRLHATGGVAVRSDEFNIDCEELLFDEENHSMEAMGERVQLQMNDIVAVGSALHYNTESGSMVLTKAEGATEQPYIVQDQETSTFTAWADEITIDQASGESVAHFDGNVQMRTTPKGASGEAASAQ